MSLSLRGYVTDYDLDRYELLVRIPYENVMDVARKQYKECEVLLDDGRTITADQRKKARAIIADICNWAGYQIKSESDNVHEILKAYFCADWGYDYFSLSNTDVTTARNYINFLIDFCLKNEVPCLDSLLNRTDDIDAYLYACLFHGKCAICGKKGELHHWDAIGMGRNRDEIIHEGMPALELCREHHVEVETVGKETFEERHHVYGIKLDKILCKRKGLKYVK